MIRMIKISAFFMALMAITVFSKTIQRECIESYNQCVTFLSHNTMQNGLAFAR
ncbi:hypothetical protein [Subsaximicrobium wynnwilliamsii]|uniref:hypothetical protein n=1 Tax=Subsaximicrobium wynnwilliamsii TaxID=291179 RepID=UPI00167309FD|nr:hypothetical protein [Subsaximicrobium wynnwilliamsii]